MSVEIKAPIFPESIAEGSISAWYKQPGDAVQVDEKIADIETDKVVLEVAAPASGTIDEILKQEGDTVQAGELIARMDAGAAAAQAAAGAPSQPAKPEAAPEPAPPPREATPPPPRPTAPAPQVAAAPAAPEAAPTSSMAPPPQHPAISPAARKLAREEGIDASSVRGSGRQGRITKSDVADAVARRAATAPPPAAEPSPPAAAPSTPSPEPAPISPPVSAAAGYDGNHRLERKPMSRLRARIAERLVEAQHTAAILTTFNEIDMKPVFDLRRRHKDAFEKQHGVRLGFMSFFVKASVEALRRYPAVNASIEGSDMLYHHYYDIGIAVSSPRGLVVPILRNADHMSFGQIEEGIRDFGVRAQANQISLEDLQGGTFTISNGGVFGSMLSTPILNPPQSGILGLHAIKDRPVAVNGQVEIRPVMYVALSYDHRIIDGREAVSFLVTVKEVMEDPARLLLQV